MSALEDSFSQFLAPLISGYFSQPELGPGHCPVCTTPINPAFNKCRGCEEHAASQYRDDLANLVLPLTYGGHTPQSHHLLHMYKTDIIPTPTPHWPWHGPNAWPRNSPTGTSRSKSDHWVEPSRSGNIKSWPGTKPTSATAPDNSQQSDQESETGSVRIHQLRQLPNSIAALRRKTQLGATGNHYTPLKSEEPD